MLLDNVSHFYPAWTFTPEIICAFGLSPFVPVFDSLKTIEQTEPCLRLPAIESALW